MRRLIDTPAVAVLASAAAFVAISCADASITQPEAATGTEMVAPNLGRIAAGPPRTGAGTWTATNFGLISTRDVGNNRIIENFVELAWEGALEGTSIHFNRLVIHLPTSTATFQNTGEFTGAVDGCDGVESFTYKSTARGDPVAGNAVGTTTIVASNATTAVVLSGVIHWIQDGLSGPYEMKYTC